MKIKNKLLIKRTILSCLIFGVSFNSFAENTRHFKPVVLNTLQKTQFQYISSELKEHNLPRSLAVIPIIEGHYNNQVVSNKGAGGLWQLMPTTAKSLGIKSKDRFLLKPSTQAAISYFSKLHRKFGNWEFAIAAYNAGDGRLRQALHHNPTATSIKQLILPIETKQYVKKFYQLRSELHAYTS